MREEEKREWAESIPIETDESETPAAEDAPETVNDTSAEEGSLAEEFLRAENAPKTPEAEEVSHAPEVEEVSYAPVANEIPKATETEVSPQAENAAHAPEAAESSAASAPAESSAASAEESSAVSAAASAAVPAARSPRQERKEAKRRAKEDVREMARETRARRKQWKMERRQQKELFREKYPTLHLRNRARRLRWKQARQTRRENLKRRYMDAPWFIRIPRLYLLRPFVVLLVLAVIAGGVVALVQSNFANLFYSWLETNKNKPVSSEEIYALSPIDKEGAKRIDAVAPVNKDDTWTISIYIVGADLEDMEENDLSAAVNAQIADLKGQMQAEEFMKTQKQLDSFTKELKDADLDLPGYLYYPTKPVKARGDSEEEANAEATDPGAASSDIGEMTSGTWSDNISVVIQTGGATRWSNTQVNPNRTQRFLYRNGEFQEVDNQPLQRATDPDTLTDFLKFSKKEYPADHNMLILWNHGGGAFGYGVDSIYGGMMSLADIREALNGAYKPDENDPPFDVIGYDACLMSSLEACHAMSGFSAYYAVSEETEPADGWNYGPWLKAMTKDPTMSPARVAREIADSYMDYYMTQNVNIGWLFTSDVNFSVLDAKKTEDLYDAWCDLSKQQLIDAAGNPSVLAEIGRCSNKSTHMVSPYYNIYNTVDLGNYVDLMVDTYPKECSRIKKLIGESVMYHRESGSLSDSQGVSIYTPGSVDSYPGLQYCLDYIYNICEDPSTKALYYYKIAGCLNEDMKEYLATLTDKEAKTLNLKPFWRFSKDAPVITDYGFKIPVDQTLQDMLQTCQLELGFYDEETQTVTNYGRDETAVLDGEGNVICEFDGSWICYDGVPLATEVVSSASSNVEYRSKVLYNGQESYLTFTYDRDTESFTINGVRGVSDIGGLFNQDPVNYLINSRMNTEVEKGDVIVPLYEVRGAGDEELPKDATEGDQIKVKKSSKIEMKPLPSGYYLTTAVVSDQRGDVYYSQVVGNDVSGSDVTERKVDSAFKGRDY